MLVEGPVVTFFFFFQAEDGIRDLTVTGVQTCALPISPQMVIDGREQFIGGRINQVSEAIRRNSHAPKLEVTIAGSSTSRNLSREFTVDIKNGGASAGEVWIVITEKGLHSEVDRGENAGKNLRHASVARWMHKVGLANSTSPEES